MRLIRAFQSMVAWQFFADRRRDEEMRFADSFEAEP